MTMLRSFIRLLFTVCLVPGYGLAQTEGPSKTMVYIIGLVHTESNLRSSDSLLSILNNIKPDLILSETDTLSGFFRSDYNLVQPTDSRKMARTLKRATNMLPEFDVLFKYKKMDPAVHIHPFDMTIRNRQNYTRDEHEWIEALEKAKAEGSLPKELDPAYEEYMQVFDLYIYMNTLGYRELNRRSLTDSIRQSVHLEETLSRKLAQEAPVLAPYRDWQTLHYMNWHKRNAIMVENILHFINKTGAKRVVVFTGLLHKFFLADKLGEVREQMELADYFAN